MAELDLAVHARIEELCASGDQFAEKRNFADALGCYWKAYDLIPDPKTDWETSTWVLVAIGDSNFLSGDFIAGRDNLQSAMHCPDAVGNPFIHLRLGQCQLELGNEQLAADELARAFMSGGMEIFRGQNPRYLRLLKSRLKPPPGGWPDER